MSTSVLATLTTTATTTTNSATRPGPAHRLRRQPRFGLSDCIGGARIRYPTAAAKVNSCRHAAAVAASRNKAGNSTDSACRPRFSRVDSVAGIPRGITRDGPGGASSSNVFGRRRATSALTPAASADASGAAAGESRFDEFNAIAAEDAAASAPKAEAEIFARYMLAAGMIFSSSAVRNRARLATMPQHETRNEIKKTAEQIQRNNLTCSLIQLLTLKTL